jgi:polyhydroxyalkanoate synthesis regulator phasin
LNTLADDSRKFVGDLKKDAEKKVKRVVVDGRKIYKKARKNPRKTLNSMVDDSQHFAEDLLKDGKSIMKGIERDARIVVDDMTDSGKKALDNLPGKKKLQKKIENRIKSVPLQFNLPTRKDIDRLMDRLENLNTKLDALGQE